MLKIEKNIGTSVDVVVMVQGDEPLIPPEAIGETLMHFDDADVNIVNVMSKLHSLEAFVDKNNVKVVVDGNSDALYFSITTCGAPWSSVELHGAPRRSSTIMHFVCA